MLTRPGLYSVALRGLTLASKFVLTIFMARTMSPEDLGLYGLFATVVYLGTVVVGLDFYLYANREVITSADAARPKLIRDQLVFGLIVYVAVSPFALVVFWMELLPPAVLGWFYLLLFLELISQEGYRLLIALSRPVAANVVLFFRQGIWIYAIVTIGFFAESLRELGVIWAGWAIGAVAGLAIIVHYIAQLPWNGALRAPVDWAWIRRGAGSGLLFLVASSALLLMTYADRFFLQAYEGTGAVGVYVFFNQMANTIQTFVNTGIVMIAFPGIVAAFQAREIARYRAQIRKMALTSIVAAVLLAAGAAVAILPLLDWLDRPSYAQELPIMWIMLGTSVLAIAALGPYYALYARRRDRDIVVSHLVALAVALGANAVLVPRFGMPGAAVSTLSGYATLAALQLVLLMRGDSRRPLVEDAGPDRPGA
ncbi:lipopolysaccharide biosynthesis protein [Salinarimonas sp. NSM]|uniref:lipopolysaccharide biosynthesis protein n=1 Tax=Salinarimonas sp. NSM TaxID=3458003 RepID=UPI004035B957